MGVKKLNLQSLIEELRLLSESYETSPDSNDVFLIKEAEVVSFSDRLVKATREFVKFELFGEIADEEIDGEEVLLEDEDLFTDWYDEEDDLD
jgi:hypothetical protein